MSVIILTRKISKTKKIGIAEVIGASCIAHAKDILIANNINCTPWPEYNVTWKDQVITEKMFNGYTPDYKSITA